MLSGFNLTPNQEQQLSSINWDLLSVEELIQLLDRLGIGFYLTLKILLTKLNSGQKKKLMELVQKADIGKVGSQIQAKQAIQVIKKDPDIPILIKHILILLGWRADKMFKAQNTPGFDNLPNLNFIPEY